jgi:hypothetical protein
VSAAKIGDVAVFAARGAKLEIASHRGRRGGAK